MKESELALHFIEYFSEGFEIFKEVSNGSGGIVDFYAFDGRFGTAVEVKPSFSLVLIEQAYTNIPYAHYNYVATPTDPGQHGLGVYFCKQLGIGILAFRAERKGGLPIVKQLLKPRFIRKAKLPIFHDFHKENIAGVQSGRMTAFREFVNTITKCCLRHSRQGLIGGIPLKDVYAMISNPYYQTLTSCQKNLYQWTRNGVIKEFTLIHGEIFLDMKYINNQRLLNENYEL